MAKKKPTKSVYKRKSDPDAPKRHAKLERLLMEGVPIKEAAKLADLSDARAYVLGRQKQWPTNTPIQPGGAKEQQILGMLGASYSKHTICAVFRIAPILLEQLIERTRQRSSNEEKLHDSD